MLMGLPQLQTRTLRNKIAEMLCITVSFAGGPEQLAIVINHAVTHADFLFAVIIHIADHEIVIALTVCSPRAVVVGIEYPANRQLAVDNI